MYLLLLVGALALAIPTFGFSVVAFLFYHNYDGRKNAKVVVQAIGLSADKGETVQMIYIGRSAIKKAFEALHSDDLEIEVYPTSKLTTFCGTVHHPRFVGPLFAQIHVQSVPRSVGVMSVSVSKIETGWIDGVIESVKAEMSSKNKAADDADVPF